MSRRRIADPTRLITDEVARTRRRVGREERVLMPRDTSALWSSGLASRPYATRVVAASNSIAPHAFLCDYRCNGTDDHEEIQQAINDCTGVGGMVLLLEGTYNVDPDEITVPSDVVLRGMGPGTILAASSTPTWAVEGNGIARRVAAEGVGNT